MFLQRIHYLLRQFFRPDDKIIRGSLPFWQLAAKYPDEAYQFFLKEGCWFIDEVPTFIDRKDLYGPFKLFVPGLSRLVTIYCIADQIDNSQAEFIELMG